MLNCSFVYWIFIVESSNSISFFRVRIEYRLKPQNNVQGRDRTIMSTKHKLLFVNIPPLDANQLIDQQNKHT